MEFSDIRVDFGKADYDMLVDYTLFITFFQENEDAPSTELLHDVVRMRSMMQIAAENDILHIRLDEHKILMDRRRGQNSEPKRTSLEMSEEDYHGFLNDFSLTASEFRKWLNDVVLRGDRITFPYNIDEFNTFLKFSPENVHVMIDVKEKADKFLEDEFWN